MGLEARLDLQQHAEKRLGVGLQPGQEENLTGGEILEGRTRVATKTPEDISLTPPGV